MEGESLSKSVWYRRLSTKYKAYLQQAAVDATFVCVPQTASLASTSISVSDIENHILRSTGTRGEFESLNGKRAIITGTEVITGAGYKEQLAARILGTERVSIVIPDDAAGGGSSSSSSSAGSNAGSRQPAPSSSRFVSLYFLARPLEGGLAAPSSVQDIEHSAAMRMIAMFRASSETEAVFAELTRVIADVKVELEANPTEATLTAARGALLEECTSAAAALNASSLFSLERGAPGVASLSSRTTSPQRQLLQVLECWCMAELHEPVMHALLLTCRSDISRLGTVLRAMATATQADVKIKPEFRCSLSPAVAALGLLQTASTPLEKLHCLRDVSLTLQRCLERHLDDVGTDLADVEFATDDMLDMLLWTIIQGQFDHHTIELPAHLDYISRFHFAAAEGELEMSRLGYYSANFQQALGFFALRFDEITAAAKRKR